MKRIISIWKMLSKPIYVGERLESNLKILSIISIVTAVLGLILTVMNLVTRQTDMLFASLATLVSGALCLYFAAIRKRRGLAEVVPLLFCMVAFTIYAVTGVGEGTGILWTLLLPIGICYFVSVRYGILLSVYYSILFSVLFYTPLKTVMSQFYSEKFMMRFPLCFLFLSIFTAVAMIQYHRTALFEMEHTNKLNEEVAKQTKVATERALKLEHITEEIVQTLAHVIDAKDKYTNGHSLRVSQYAVALAEKLGWSEDQLSDLRWEAMLHDIGKIGIPDAVLNKPGKLTEEEFARIKSHATIGGDILLESSELIRFSETARFHHERYDGHGYPQGIAGESIPVNARIVAIADAYDAMHSDRIYRKGLSADRIREELVNGRGTQFDPLLLDRFLELFDSGELETQDPTWGGKLPDPV